MCAPDPNPNPNPNRHLPCGDHRARAHGPGAHGGVGGVLVSILRLLGRSSYGSARRLMHLFQKQLRKVGRVGSSYSPTLSHPRYPPTFSPTLPTHVTHPRYSPTLHSRAVGTLASPRRCRLVTRDTWGGCFEQGKDAPIMVRRLLEVLYECILPLVTVSLALILYQLHAWAPLTTSRHCNQCSQTPIYHLLDLSSLVATHLNNSTPRCRYPPVSPRR